MTQKITTQRAANEALERMAKAYNNYCHQFERGSDFVDSAWAEYTRQRDRLANLIATQPDPTP